MIGNEELLTVLEIMERKNVPQGTVESAISRGKLPSLMHPVLKRRMVKIADVDAWVIGRGGSRTGAGRPRKTTTETSEIKDSREG